MIFIPLTNTPLSQFSGRDRLCRRQVFQKCFRAVAAQVLVHPTPTQEVPDGCAGHVQSRGAQPARGLLDGMGSPVSGDFLLLLGRQIFEFGARVNFSVGEGFHDLLKFFNRR